MKKNKKTVFIVYENLRVSNGGLKRMFVDVFSTRKKASDYVKGKKCLIAECEVK